MNRYVNLFLLLFVVISVSYSQDMEYNSLNYLNSLKKLDYNHLNADNILMYSKTLTYYRSKDKEYKEPNINKLSIPELIIMAESYYMDYDFEKCENVLQKLNYIQKRSRKKIPYIQDLDSKLDRATKIINSTDIVEIKSSKIYNVVDAENGIHIPFNDGEFTLKFTFDSISKQFIPKYINLTGEYDRRIYNNIDSLGNNNIEYQLYVDGEWINSKVSTKEITTDTSFPYLNNDGITVYFSKKSNEGFGGYDLYMSRLDIDNSEFFAPSLLGMPYNSPFNDYFMLYNQKENLFYLVTDRMLNNGYLAVIEFKEHKKDSSESVSMDNIKSNAELSDYIKYISNDEPNVKTNKTNDYYFRINKDIIIKNISDFKSNDAKNCFVKSIKCKSNIQKLEDLLNNKIKEYNKTSNTEDKETIAKVLEEYRNRLNILNQEYDNLLIEVKNYEIKYNKNN